MKFLPTAEKTNETLLSDEVEIGKEYAIYITNYAGLYRYRVGDIVKITDVKDGVPYFSYVGRTNEKISEQNIYHALREVMKQKNVYLNDFCFEKDDDNRLTIYIEIKDNKKQIVLNWLIIFLMN